MDGDIVISALIATIGLGVISTVLVFIHPMFGAVIASFITMFTVFYVAFSPTQDQHMPIE